MMDEVDDHTLIAYCLSWCHKDETTLTEDKINSSDDLAVEDSFDSIVQTGPSTADELCKSPVVILPNKVPDHGDTIPEKDKHSLTQKSLGSNLPHPKVEEDPEDNDKKGFR